MNVEKLAIGVDIGGTRTKIGLVDLSLGKVINTIVSPTEKKSSSKFLKNIKCSIDQLISGDIEGKSISGIGIGVPGFVFENGTVDSTYGFLEFMEDYPLVSMIEEYCLMQCRIDNDARMVALGESLYGKAKNYERVLVLTLGTGLGVGFVVNKKLENLLPYGHMAGHMTICNNSVSCYCGKNGCLEAMVSATGIVNAAVRSGWMEKSPYDTLDAETVFKTAEGANEMSKQIVLEMVENMQKGIGNYINIYAPDAVVIGGGMAKSMGPYLPMLENKNVLKPFKNYQVTIILSELAEHSGILGSAALFND